MTSFKRICKSVLSMVLIIALMLQLVSCFIPKPDPDDGEGDDDEVVVTPPETGKDDEFPNLDEIITVFINLAQTQPLVGQASTSQRTIKASELASFKTEVKANAQEGLTSYSSKKLDVVYDTNADEYGVYDTVTVNDKILLEQYYYTTSEEDELTLDGVYADYYEVEVDYNTDGRVEGLYYYDRYYIYHYDTDGNLTEIYLNGEKYKAFSYNANGNIVSEESVTENNSFINTYAYTENGKLYSVNGTKVASPVSASNGVSVANVTFAWNGQTISYNDGNNTAEFKYEYSFNDESFLTEKTVSGCTTTYGYVGDKVVEINSNGHVVSYILDKDLNYVGLAYDNGKYYFVVDPYGNVMGLVDADCNFVVEYQYDIWGNICGISGELADSLGVMNEVVNLNGLYDHTLNCYFFADSIYLASEGITLNQQSVSYAKDMYQWNQSNYFYRSAVSSFALIHDMVVEVAVKNLKEQGVDVVSNLYATDKNGDSRRLVDIYTLDYSLTPFSSKNLLHGNQIYEVIYHAPESEKFFDIAKKKLQEITDNWSVSYFGKYYPDAGRMTFHGQFIFLEYLIDYKCEENGIIEYQVKNNIEENYDQTINIFDYDKNEYVCYVNNTFDLNFLDGITIVPGVEEPITMSEEQYKSIDAYLSEYLQPVSGNICDQMLIYDDPNYYNLENMNVLPDYWAQMNLEDTTTYLEIQTDGTVIAKEMPAYETDGFITKIAIGAGVVAVTAIVAIVVIMIPGLNCGVIASICVGAAKGAAIAAASGFAMGLVEPLVGIAFEGIVTGEWDWSKYDFNKALNSAATGFMTGAITGAIMGAISGGLNPKYCFAAGTPIATETGSVAIEDIAVGDTVWSYDYKTGEKSLKPVTATTVRETNRIITLEIDGEEIVTTPEHPFYVVNNDKYDGYVAAKYLSAGDCILTASGEYLPITSIKQETLDEPITVYNFTVDDNHSYYASQIEILAHNASCNEISSYYPDSQNRQFDNYKSFKKFYGKAGKGCEWHHIVEQSQVKNGISAQNIYSVKNTIRLDYATHRKITGIYNTKIGNLGTKYADVANLFDGLPTDLTVRQYMFRLTYEQQFEFGVKILKLLGVYL